MVVLIQALKEVVHPVSKRLECGRGKLTPNVGDLSVKQRTRNFIQLAAHSHFTSEGLGKKAPNQFVAKRRVK